MAKFWLCAAVGFYLLQLSLAQIGLNISCRYAGVFHVEKNHRYSLTRDDAVELCRALNSTIPTMEQMEKAFELGFETCRYGYIEEKIVVPRQTPYPLCAANNTGIYILSSNVSDRYDTYCFNSSELRDKVCDPVKKLYSVWPEDGSTIEIFNADGSRYIEGERFTEQTPLTDDDSSVGSGSAHDKGVTDPSIIRTSHFPHHEDYPTSTTSYVERDDVSKEYEPDQSEDSDPESTTVSSSDDVREENATHDSTVHDQLHEWSKEEKYSPNSTVDEVLAGIIPSAGNNEEKYEHTDEVSQGVYEDSTPEPVRDSEDKYTTKSTAPVFHGIVPRRGINQKNKTDHTGIL
uniref:CD44 antigen n=1 Tax=Salvator merianae TaxID=96440 RepID=A0A8D0BB49_SALMN